MIDKRIHKIKCDYGMNDYFRYYNKIYKGVDRATFGKVITDFNKEIGKLIVNNHLEYGLPKLGYHLMLRKDQRKPKIKNGKLLNNIPVDWKKTNILWDNNPEAKEKKLLVRYNNSHTSGYIYRIYLKKFGVKLKYRSIYKAQINRELKRYIAKQINESDKPLDAYLLYKNK